MDEFPANSNKARATTEPREKIKPVTSAKKAGKKGLGRQFKETFFSGNGKDAAAYMAEAVIVPAIRDTLHEALQAGIERVIYGDRASSPRRGYSTPWSNQGENTRVAYDRISSSGTKPQRSMSRQAKSRHSFDELIIDTRQEAEEVLERMYDILSQYGEVSVAHLYELTGIRSDHTDMKWGWTNLRGSKAVRLRQGGFLLDLPSPISLT